MKPREDEPFDTPRELTPEPIEDEPFFGNNLDVVGRIRIFDGAAPHLAAFLDALGNTHWLENIDDKREQSDETESEGESL